MTFEPDRGRPLEYALAEAALGRVLQAMVQMPGVAQVAEATLNACRSVSGAAEVYLLVRRGDRLRLQAAIGLEPSGGPVELAWDEGLEGQALRLGQTIHRLNPADDPVYCPMPGRQGPPGVLAALPLRLRGETTGVLACARSAPVPFNDVELRWLRHFADMLAVAAENGRLLAGERRSRAQEEILGRVAAVPGGEVREFCQRMAEALAEVLGMHYAGILLHDPARAELVILGWAPAQSAAPRRSRLSLDKGGALAEALRRNEVWVLQGGPTVRELADACGVEEPSSALLAPLTGAGGPRGLLLLLGDDALSVEEQDAAFLRLVAERVALTLNRAEVELVRARSQARQEFLAVVSHELRTPLAVIKAYTEVLARRAETRGLPGDDARIVGNISEQVDLMQGMVEHLLDLQRLDGGQLPLELSRFDLGALAGRAVEAVQATTNRHHLALEASEPAPALADRRRIYEVLTNLLENAVKYSPDGGAIKVQVRRYAGDDRREMALVTVSDQGVGISADDLPHVFDRFFQGDLPPVRGRRGMGLGLAIAREIIARHGGQVWAHSEPGRGSTFTFSLPLAGPEADA